jgi:hypothetical protein
MDPGQQTAVTPFQRSRPGFAGMEDLRFHMLIHGAELPTQNLAGCFESHHGGVHLIDWKM